MHHKEKNREKQIYLYQTSPKQKEFNYELDFDSIYIVARHDNVINISWQILM